MTRRRSRSLSRSPRRRYKSCSRSRSRSWSEDDDRDRHSYVYFTLYYIAVPSPGLNEHWKSRDTTLRQACCLKFYLLSSADQYVRLFDNHVYTYFSVVYLWNFCSRIKIVHISTPSPSQFGVYSTTNYFQKVKNFFADKDPSCQKKKKLKTWGLRLGIITTEIIR